MRGVGMSRIDAFSDVVFGFAITLLVVSLEVPKSFEELRGSITGFLPFAICFTMLLLVWYSHYQFFRRYNLHDTLTIVLNSCLLFVVLFYVYPLKFVWSIALGSARAPLTAEDVKLLMLLYGIGYTSVYVLFGLLYIRAYSLRSQLDLNAVELLATKASIVDHFGLAGIGVLSCAIALLLPPAICQIAGYIYFLIGPFKFVHGTYFGKKHRMLVRTTPLLHHV